MKFIPQSIPEIILVAPKVHQDERGYFFESFRQNLFEEAVGHSVNFIQDNESKSKHGILRGLHAQSAPFAQSKLVRVIQGRVLDVAVDIRQGSPSFGQHVAVELSEENKHQLFVPRGFAHGFIVLSELAIFSYKVDNLYAPDNEIGLSAFDPDLAIDWQLPYNNIQRSSRDNILANLKDIDNPFRCDYNYYG